jgi:hypothetical protein
LEVEGRKKKALDKHLDFLVGQTERYAVIMLVSLDQNGHESNNLLLA